MDSGETEVGSRLQLFSISPYEFQLLERCRRQWSVLRPLSSVLRFQYFSFSAFAWTRRKFTSLHKSLSSRI